MADTPRLRDEGALDSHTGLTLAQSTSSITVTTSSSTTTSTTSSSGMGKAVQGLDDSGIGEPPAPSLSVTTNASFRRTASGASEIFSLMSSADGDTITQDGLMALMVEIGFAATEAEAREKAGLVMGSLDEDSDGSISQTDVAHAVMQALGPSSAEASPVKARISSPGASDQAHHRRHHNLGAISGWSSTEDDECLSSLRTLFISCGGQSGTIGVDDLRGLLAIDVEEGRVGHLGGWSDQSAITREHAETVMAQIDLNGDHELDFDEFCEAFRPLVADPKNRSVLAAQAAALLQERAALTREIETLKGELLRMEQGYEAKLAQFSLNSQSMEEEYTTTVGTLTQENTGLKAKLREARGQLAEARKRIDGLETSHHEFLEKEEQMEDRISRFDRQVSIEKQRRHSERVEHETTIQGLLATSANPQADGQLRQLRAACQDLQRRLSDAQDEMRGQQEAARRALADSAAELQEVRQAKADEADMHEDQLREARRDIADLRARIDELVCGKSEHFRAAFDASNDVAALHTELLEAQGQLTDLRADHAALSEEYSETLPLIEREFERRDHRFALLCDRLGEFKGLEEKTRQQIATLKALIAEKDEAIAELEARAVELTEANQRVAGELAAAHRERFELQRLLSREQGLAAHLAATTAQLDTGEEFRTKLEDLQAILLAEEAEKMAVEKAREAAEDHLRAGRQREARLRAQLDAATDTRDQRDVQQLREQLSKLQAEVRRLNTDLASARAAAGAGRGGGMEAAAVELREQLASSRVAVAEQHARVLELEADAERLRGELQGGGEREAHLTAAVGDARAATLQAEQRAKRAAAEFAAQAAGQHGELKRLRSEVLIAREAMQRELKARQMVSALEAQLAVVQGGAEAEAAPLRQRVTELEGELGQVRADLAARDTVGEELTRLRAKHGAEKDRRTALAKEVASLETQLHKAHDRIAEAAADLADLAASRNALLRRLEQHEGSERALQAELAASKEKAVRLESECGSRLKQSQAVRKTSKRLASRLRQAEAQRDSLEAAARDRDEALLRIEGLEADLALLEAGRETAFQRIAALEEECGTASLANAALTRQAREHQAAAADRTTTMNELASRLEATVAKLATAEARAATAEARATTADEACSALRAQLDKAQERVRSLELETARPLVLPVSGKKGEWSLFSRNTIGIGMFVLMIDVLLLYLMVEDAFAEPPQHYY